MALAEWTQKQVLDQLDSGSHWSARTITYAFPTSSSGIFGRQEAAGFQGFTATEQKFAELALQTWDDLIAPNLQKASSAASNIEFGTSTAGVDYAHSYMPTNGSVWLSRAYSSLASPQVGGHSFLTYVHETGHAFGLEHMGDYNGGAPRKPSSYQDSSMYSVMSYYGPSWGSGSSNGEGLVSWADWVAANGTRYEPQTPMLNDIMAMQAIYGADRTTRSGDTVYGFGCNVAGTLSAIYNFVTNLNPILTIYDAAGNDTLNLGGWSTPSSVDLNPGAFSSCNSMTSNLAIAYSCNIENAVTGAGDDRITGNALGNYLDAGPGNDAVSGGDGDDTLVAGSGNDTLEGGNGTDRMTGGSGNDSMDGGEGSDVYLIAVAADHPAAEIADSGSSGSDEVRFSASVASTLKLYAGDTGIERAVIGTGTKPNASTTGSDALSLDASELVNGISLTGNSGANTLSGTAYGDVINAGSGADKVFAGAGDDTIFGGLGNDTLSGGDGADWFVFNITPSSTANKDVLTDFMPGSDKIVLSLATFKALGSSAGDLGEAQFWSGAGAVKGHDADDRIVYDTASGALYYDADGSKPAAPVLVAVIGVASFPEVSSADFKLVA